MSDEKNRPVEVHFTTPTNVERGDLPFLSSLVYGEIYTSEMLNSKDFGLKKPGIYTGLNPVPDGGFKLRVAVADNGYSSAMATIGTQNITVIQQHDVVLEIPNGERWNIVLDVFYERGVKTRQVDVDSTVDSAKVIMVKDEDLEPDHVVICVVDLQHGPSELTQDDIDTSTRVERYFDVDDHAREEDPHPQYTTDEESSKISNDEIDARLTTDHTGGDATLIASQKAVKAGVDQAVSDAKTYTDSKVDMLLGDGASDALDTFAEVEKALGESGQALSETNKEVAKKVDKSQVSHAVDSVSETDVASSKAVKAVQDNAETKVAKSSISDSTTSDSSVTVASSKAVKAVQDNANTKVSKSAISRDHTANSPDTVASSQALGEGLATKAEKKHSHDIDDLPVASTAGAGVTMLVSDVTSESEDEAATPKAVKAANDNANTRIAKADISSSLTSDSETTVASSKALSEVQANANRRVEKSSVSDAVDSDAPGSVASSKAVKTANDNAETRVPKSAVSSAVDSISETDVASSHAVKKVQDNAGSRVSKSNISHAVDSTSEDDVASSKAVKTVQDDVNTKVAKTDISSAADSQSETTVASSKAVATVDAKVDTKVAKSSVSDAVNSASSTDVASSAAVKTVQDNANSRIPSSAIDHDHTTELETKVPSSKALKEGLDTKAEASHSHGVEDLPQATTTTQGVTTLSDSVTSDSSGKAATSKAVKTVQDNANSRIPNNAKTDDYESVSSDEVTTGKALSDGLATKADAQHSHGEADLPQASITARGITKLSNAVTSTATDVAATPKAVKTVQDNANTKVPKSAVSDAVDSITPGSVASSAAVKTVQDNANTKIAKSSISSSTTSASTTTVASSAALKSVQDNANTKVAKSSISDETDSDSSTTVASSKALMVGLDGKVDNDLAVQLGEGLGGSTNMKGPLVVTPDFASVTKRGIVQLVDSVTSTSLILAPTANAVKMANDNANTRVAKASISNSYTSAGTTTVASSKALKDGLATKAEKSHSHGVADLPRATLLALGVTILSNAVDSDAEDTAATSMAVKTTHDFAATKVAKSSITQSYSSTSTTAVASAKALSAGLATKANKSHSHGADDLPDASITGQGVVQLTNSVTSTSQTIAPTAKALKSVQDNANSRVSKSSISNSLTSTSTTTVASSKAANDLYVLASTNLNTAKSYTDQRINALLGDMPQETLDTFTEIAAAFKDADDAFAAVNAELAKKVAKTSISNATNSTSTTTVASSKALKIAYDLAASKMTQGTADGRYIRSFIVEDGDGTERSITQAKEWKFVQGSNMRINWTDTDSGSDADPYDLTFSVPNASTAGRGAVQLTSATNSTSETLAATAKGVKAAFDLAASKMTQATGDARYLGINAKAKDADKLDGLNSSQFLRSDAYDIKTSGELRFNDNIVLGIGTGGDVEHFWNGSNYYTDINGGANWYIRDGNSSNATRFTFDVDNGYLTATRFIGYLQGQAAHAAKWSTARTLSLSGDATGSVSMDGSANTTLSVSVKNDSHTHAWGNITGKPSTFTPTTEVVQDIVGAMVSSNSESGIAVTYDDAKGKLNFNVADPTITLVGDLTGSAKMTNLGNVSISAQVKSDSHNHSALYERNAITYGWTGLQYMDQSGTGGTGANGSTPQNPSDGWWHHLIMNHGNSSGYYVDIAANFHGDDLRFRRNESGVLKPWQRIFHDGYHPNADKWTTKRRITLAGDLSGYVDLDGSANVTLSASVGNASHTHSWANITGVPSATTSVKGIVQLTDSVTSTSQTLAATAKAVKTAMDKANSAYSLAASKMTQSTADGRYLGKTAKAADADKLDGLNSSQFIRSDADDTKTGYLQMQDNAYFRLGSGGDVEHFWNGSNYYTDINGGGNWYLRDGNSSNATRFTFDIDSGYLTATGRLAGTFMHTTANSGGSWDNNNNTGLLVNATSAGSAYNVIRVNTDNGFKIQTLGGTGGSQRWYTSASNYITFQGTTITASLSGTASNANKLDNLDSTQFLRSDADDTFSGKLISSHRGKGLYGAYDSYKTDQIWSMGTAYNNASDGSNFGNLYGLAYKHTNNKTGGTMAGSHQVVWAENGTPKAAMGGSGIWGLAVYDGAGTSPARVYSPNNRNISDSVTSTSTTTYASLKAVKTAMDKANSAYSLAASKMTQSTADGRYLGKTAKAADADKLDGINSTSFMRSDATDTVSAITGWTGGKSPYIQDSNGGRIPAPGGAAYRSTTGGHTGAVKIKLPTVTKGKSDMISMEVTIFDYSANESVKLLISGYQYGSVDWTNQTVVILARRTDRDYKVRFGNDSTSHCLWIGEVGSTWSHPQVSVTNVQVGYSADPSQYASGWAISFVTKFDTVQDTVVSNLPVAEFATTTDRLRTARTIALSGDLTGSTSFSGAGNATISATVKDNSHKHTWSNITGVPSASTSAKGIVQLTSSTSSTSTSLAATASAVRAAYNLAAGKMTQATADGRYLGKTAKAADADKIDGYDISQLMRRIDNTTDYKTSANIMCLQERANSLPVGLTGAYSYGGLLTMNDGASRFRMYAPHNEGGKSALYFNTGWNSDQKAWERVMTFSQADASYLGKTAKAADSSKLNGKTNATAPTANTIVQRDGSGDITARLVRTTYGVTTSAPAATAEIVFRNNGSSDNFHRTMTKAAMKSWLSISKSDVGLSNVPNYAFTTSVSDASTTKFASASAVRSAYNLAASKMTQSTADGRYLGKTAKAADADKLDGINSSQFVRSDANDTKTGYLQMQDNANLKFGSGGDIEFFWNGTAFYTDFVNDGTWYWRNSKNQAPVQWDVATGSVLLNKVSIMGGTANYGIYFGQATVDGDPLQGIHTSNGHIAIAGNGDIMLAPDSYGNSALTATKTKVTAWQELNGHEGVFDKGDRVYSPNNPPPQTGGLGLRCKEIKSGALNIYMRTFDDRIFVAGHSATSAFPANYDMKGWRHLPISDIRASSTNDGHQPIRDWAVAGGTVYVLYESGTLMAFGANHQYQIDDSQPATYLRKAYMIGGDIEEIVVSKSLRSSTDSCIFYKYTSGSWYYRGANRYGSGGCQEKTAKINKRVQFPTHWVPAHDIKVWTIGSSYPRTFAYNKDLRKLVVCGYNNGSFGTGATSSDNVSWYDVTAAWGTPTEILAITGSNADTNTTTAMLVRRSSSLIELRTCGYNGYGECGDGTTTKRTSPVKVRAFVTNPTGGDPSYSEVEGGVLKEKGRSFHFIAGNGAWLRWGRNYTGQLGTGNTTTIKSPVLTKLGENARLAQPEWDDVWAGLHHTAYQAVVYKNGSRSVLAAGDSGRGTLPRDQETTGNRTVLSSLNIAVHAPIKYAQIHPSGAGSSHAGNTLIIVTEDGGLYMAGCNYSGVIPNSLGDISETDCYFVRRVI